MRSRCPSFLSAFLVCCAYLAVPAYASAAEGDCGQPSSGGTNPVASDAQSILKAAVGQTGTDCEAKPCICDVNASGDILTSDAQLVLRKAVGQTVTLNCECPPPFDPLVCTSFELRTAEGSEMDLGWSGRAHDTEISAGASVGLRVKHECSGTTADVECDGDDDCTGNGFCQPTCDCGTDTSCELTGPTGGTKCVNTLTDCETNRCIVGSSTTATVCTTDADCGAGTCSGSSNCQSGIACAATFGPPQPLVAAEVPTCTVSWFDGPVTGTADTATGAMRLAVNLKSRVYLGDSTLEKPCPVCGAPGQDPNVGDVFTCIGGQSPGASCTVEGVTPDFGGTSSDCAPKAAKFLSTQAIRIRELTTGTSTKTARLPCKFFGFGGNPLLPGSEPKCLDKNLLDDPVCTSNADCLRCTEATTITCTSNADCTGNGVCAAAPEHPVTCGFWCHCGLCGGDPLLPCFEGADCPSGLSCVRGPGIGTQANAAQTKSNDCLRDKYICGGETTERCRTSFVGSCSGADYRDCETNADCAPFDAGNCNLEPNHCFEPRITRTGAPSPLGAYCAFENKACTTNLDCAGSGDFCVESAARPTTVGLFCAPTTPDPLVNAASGLMGPGALSLNSLLVVCRCGDSLVGCDEDCDDGNTVPGDGCDHRCQDE